MAVSQLGVSGDLEVLTLEAAGATVVAFTVLGITFDHVRARCPPPFMALGGCIEGLDREWGALFEEATGSVLEQIGG